jgi:hypothetical protein
MSPAMQDALAALATDARVRERFARDPASTLSALGDLAPRERAALLALPPVAIDRYARSLVAKRWHEVARVMPLTLRIAPNVEARYRAWVAVNPARAIDTVLSPGAAEAFRALVPLRAALLDDDGAATYAADLLAFEVLGACARGDGEVRTLRSRFAVHAIARDLRRGLIPIDPTPVTTDYRFDRAGVKWRGA